MTEVAEIQGEVLAPEPKAKKRGNGKALAVATEASAPVIASSEGDAFLAMIERAARDPSVDIDKMERLLDRRDRMDAEARVRAFNAAMAAAKAEFEPIVKRHLVDFVNKDGKRTTYKHEDLADVSAAVDPVLARHGLNTRYRATSNPNEPIACTCVVTHSAGHFEETTLSAGADATGGKNTIQAIASTLSYLQRMTKKAALGLAASRDDDGNAAGSKPSDLITDAQCQTILDKIAETQSDPERFCNYFKIAGVAKLPATQFDRALGLLNQKGRKA